MKKVLSLLVAFVFLQVQTWALSGGPVYTSDSGDPSIIGTYGGVLVPTSSTETPTSLSVGAIGLFSVSVPQTGIAAGVAIVFVQGTAFIGQIAGVSDTKGQSIQGVIAGTSNFTVTESLIQSDVFVTDPATGITTETVTYQQKDFPVFAEGSFKATVTQGDAGAFTQAAPGSGNGTSTAGNTSTSSTTSEVGNTNAARLDGTAQIGTFFNIDSNSGTPIINAVTNYTLDGIKQSNIPSNVTTVPFSFGGSTGG